MVERCSRSRFNKQKRETLAKLVSRNVLNFVKVHFSLPSTDFSRLMCVKLKQWGQHRDPVTSRSLQCPPEPIGSSAPPPIPCPPRPLWTVLLSVINWRTGVSQSIRCGATRLGRTTSTDLNGWGLDNPVPTGPRFH